MARVESSTVWQFDRSKIDFTPEFPSVIVFLVLVLAAPVDLYLAYRAFTSDMKFANLIGVLIIGAMIGLVMLAVSQTNQGIVGSFESNASDKEIHEEIVRLFAPSGWSLNSSTDSEIWYSNQNGPRTPFFVLLLFFGFFPAMVYLIVARNTQVAHISWDRGDGGWVHIDVGVTPSNPHGRKIAKWLHNQLGA
ncbi:MAG: hypothetical protein ACRDHN_19915 [Thermomicrobiales bacterium]